MSERTERFRLALESARGDDPFKQMSMASLLAIADQDSELRRVADEVLASSRAELDLHLAGAGVADHETAAAAFGKFVTRTAATVKELAKSATGISRLGARLQVVAPSPGSVRVVFKAPEPQKATGGLGGVDVETVEAAALRKLAALLLQAEHGDDGSPLDAAVHGLRGEARRALRLLGQSVVEAHWRLSGELRQRGRETTPVELSEAGAQRLVAATTDTRAEVTTETLRGTVDGWIWSEATMIFEPDQGRRIRAAVDEALQEDVAALVHEHGQAVLATFTVVTTFPPGDLRSARRSYSLTSVERIDTQIELEPE